MRLVDLEPSFIGHGGPGISNADGSPVPYRAGVGLTCNCPCGCEYELYVPFANPIDGGPCAETRNGSAWDWQRAGDTFETLTLTPSIQRHEPCPKRWHGFITNGEIRTC